MNGGESCQESQKPWCFMLVWDTFNQYILHEVTFLSDHLHCLSLHPCLPRLLVLPPWFPPCDPTLTTWMSTSVTQQLAPSLWWHPPWGFLHCCPSWKLCAKARSRGRLATQASKLSSKSPSSWVVQSFLTSRILWRLLSMVSSYSSHRLALQMLGHVEVLFHMPFVQSASGGVDRE